MDGIKIEVIGNVARVIEKPSRITSGTVGLPVEFTFNSHWEGLSKTAVFRAGHISKIVDGLEAEAIVPWEVLEKPKAWLAVGVYGVNEDGSVAIPTTWVNVAVIQVGVDPEGDPTIDPTLPMWQKLANEVERIEDKVDSSIVTEGVIDELQEQVDSANTTAQNAHVTAQNASDAVDDLQEQVDDVRVTAVEATSKAETAEAVAKGRATGYVFDTVADLDAWLNVPANSEKLLLGDNLYIRATEVPDYWWDGEQKQILETQKVDLDEYVKNTDYATQDKAGVIKTANSYGLNVTQSTGMLGIYAANEAQINAKVTNHCPITPAKLDYAVKAGITTNTLKLTDDEKTSACSWMGAVKQVPYDKNNAKQIGSDGYFQGFAYVRKYDDTEAIFPIGNQAQNYTIPIREHTGNFYVSNPIGATHCANKGYVDNLINPLAALFVEDADHPGCYYRMVGEEKEWHNPPMANAAPASTSVPASIPDNCEYRTTQRLLGKPVYTMLVDFGAFNSSSNTTKFYYPANIIERVLKIEGSLNDGRAIPIVEDSVHGTMGIALGASGNAIGFTASGVATEKNPIIQVWYTKKEE